MEIDHKRLGALAFVLVLVVSTLPLGIVGQAGALPTEPTGSSSGDSFTVRQDSACYVVEAYTGLPAHVDTMGTNPEFGPYRSSNWDGRVTVESVMDYRFDYDPNGDDEDPAPWGQNAEDAPYLDYRYRYEPWDYSTYGLYNWSENGESHMFFYEGANGISLVMRHDRLYDTRNTISHDPYDPVHDRLDNGPGFTRESPGGGAATFEFRNLPQGEWAYLDDALPSRYRSDVFEGEGTAYYHQNDEGDGTSYKNFHGGNFTIEWRWWQGTNDGGAYRGFENLDGEMTINPQFNEQARLYGTGPQDDTHQPVTSWEIRDARTNEWYTLNMNEPLTITRGSNCDGETTPTTTTTTTTTTTATTTTTTTTTPENTTTPTTTTTETTTTSEETTTTTEEETTTENSGSDGNSGSSSSGGSASFGGGASPPSVMADVEQAGQDRVTVDVQNAREGENVDFRIPADAQTTKGLRFTNLDIAMADDDSHFVLDLTTSADAPADVPAIEGADATMGYVQVGHKYLNDEQVKSATFDFTVSKARLDEAGLAAEDVSLYRRHGGEWTRLNTSVAEEKTDRYVLEADSPGFSTFAVAGTRTVSVADLSLSESTIEAGGDATLSATVENTGPSERTYLAELALDGEVVDSKEVSVAPGGTADVTFSRTFEESGDYRLSVGDASADLVVEERQTNATTDGVETSIQGGETESDGQPGFGPLAALIALAGAMLLAGRRR